MHILLRIVRHNIGTKLFDPETKTTDLCGEMIASLVDEYKDVNEVGSKLELILYWVRDYVAIFKKESILLINLNQLIVNEISRIDIIIGGYHGQGTFRFPIKLFFVVKSEKIVEHISSIVCILCKKIMALYSKNQ